MQQNLLLFYFSKAQQTAEKRFENYELDPSAPVWQDFPFTKRMRVRRWGQPLCQSHESWIGNGNFFGVLQHAVFKVPTFAAGGWKRGLDLWQNLWRFVFQWSLWPQEGIAQLQLLDLGISNAGTFWTTFFLGGLFRSVKALLPRQWHVESGPWACWNSGHLESLGTFWCSVRWCFWLIVASTRDKADYLVCKCIIHGFILLYVILHCSIYGDSHKPYFDPGKKTKTSRLNWNVTRVLNNAHLDIVIILESWELPDVCRNSPKPWRKLWQEERRTCLWDFFTVSL